MKTKSQSPEHPSNIQLVCDDHAPKADPSLVQAPLEQYIGKFLKKAFHHKDRTEHMWILIKGIDDGAFVGQLDNDPVIIRDLKCGDTVKILPTEVEDIYIEEEGDN